MLPVWVKETLDDWLNAAANLEQIQFRLGRVSVQTTEKPWLRGDASNASARP